jgi:hypothetical protein
MWDPRRRTTLWASTACYRDSFSFTVLRNKDMFTLPASSVTGRASECKDNAMDYLSEVLNCIPHSLQANSETVLLSYCCLMRTTTTNTHFRYRTSLNHFPYPKPCVFSAYSCMNTVFVHIIMCSSRSQNSPYGT